MTIGWKARVINGAGSWISFSLLWTCVGINTHTHILRQKYLRVFTVAPGGRLRA